jgi:hypothetical protein
VKLSLRGVFGIGILLAALSSGARAYTFESPLSDGCHELITIDALRAVRERSDAARPLPASKRDQLWIEDLPVELPHDARDLGAASLVAGVRHNDLKGAESFELAELVHVHGDPSAQREHCMRAPEHDEPRGTQQALQACRQYILERFEVAVSEGFDAAGEVDQEARTELAIDLDFAGKQRVPMPTAYVEIGSALHALQDSFSHAIRSEDGRRVRVLLNWVDLAHERLEPARDGPAHRGALDECHGIDTLRRARLARAVEASSALLDAAFRTALSPSEKLTQARSVLDAYLSFEPGCDGGNGFCDAPELRYDIAEGGCAVMQSGAGSRHARLLGVLGAMLLIALAVRARRTRSTAIALILIGLATARTAAQASDAASEAPAAALPSAFALRGALSASIDEAGAALTGGARYRLSPHSLVGLDAEWNPWASLETGRVRLGALNVYATLVLRVPVSDVVALRVTGHAGISTLLFDMYGASSGSTGPYLGISLLGLEVSLSRTLMLVIDPADVAIAIPHVTGIPFVRRQYRATVGIELWL